MQPRRGDDIRGRVRRLFAFFVTQVARLRTLGNAPAARDNRNQEIVQQLFRNVLREGETLARVLGPENHRRSGDVPCISGHIDEDLWAEGVLANNTTRAQALAVK